MSKIAVLAPLFFLCLNVQAAPNTKFEVFDDEFGSGQTQRLVIVTRDPSLGGMSISCHSGKKLQVEVHAVEEWQGIQPNYTRDGYMWAIVTYKGEGASDAVHSEWRMNMMDFDTAWLWSGVDRLIEHMQAGNQISMRLGKAGLVFRFPTIEAKKHLGKILSACS